MKDRTESSTRHEGAKARRDDRRTLLKAGLFAAVGLGAAPLLRGLARGSRAATIAVPPPDSTRSKGPHDPGVGELARAGLSGYLGLNGAECVAVASSCLLCAAVCGIIGYRERGRIVKVEGNPDCPNNRGMICGKGQAGVNQVHDPDRLLHPLVRVGKRGEGRWKRLPMDKALDLIAFGGTIAGRQVQGLKSLYESGKPEEFMLHCGDGRLGNALEHFMKTAFGSGTISRETSLRDTAKRLGDELTIGASRDVNDVANSRYVLLFGANVLEAHPGHAHLAQRLIEAKAAGAKLVTFDVRLSNTAAMSDEWIAIRPGTDLAVILAMTNVILNEPAAVGSPLMDEAFLATWSNVTADELRGHYARYTPEWAEKESGVPAEAIRRIALEFASRRPGTVVTSGGLVGHYNGAYAEWAAKTLDALAGNVNVRGGTTAAASGTCKDAYADKVAAERKQYVRRAVALDILDGERLHLPTHGASQRVLELIADGSRGRPRVYMATASNEAYTTGDCARTREILANEEFIPFLIAVDAAMSETAAMADLIIPAATYLECWDLEAPPSYARIPFLQLRQPVASPAGEALDVQGILIRLAHRIGGGMAALHPFKDAAEYVEACVRLQDADNHTHGRRFYTVDGQPLNDDAWEYLRKYGLLLQAASPTYVAHARTLTESERAGTITDEETGVIWDPAKAGVSPDDARTTGYAGSKDAHKGYVGQMVGGVAYRGFVPETLNKSGLFEIRSELMPPAADSVMADVAPFLRSDETWVAEHLAAGLPCWVPVPEHRARNPRQLVLIRFQVNVETHSRTQNCKWLQEIHHKNPAWINPATAQRLLGPEAKEGDLVRIRVDMPALGQRAGNTEAREITARLHLTQGIHPEVIALSDHCGHWAYGRDASGMALDASLTGAEPDTERIWWQKGKSAPGDPNQWSDIRGVHPNWIIPNTPARVSGQFRSNDTVVTVSRA